MKCAGRLLVAVVALLCWAGQAALAGDKMSAVPILVDPVNPAITVAAAVPADRQPPRKSAPVLEVLAEVGPWPTLSAMIGYRGRLWFANSVRYPDHNSADLYSIGLAAGDLRFERHLFSQDVGTPVVAGGLLYWPFEDPRPSVGWGHVAVTDGNNWQLRIIPGEPRIFHAHAMEKLGGRLFAATSAWRTGLHVSTDGGLQWRQIYDHQTPARQVSRITALASISGRLFGAVDEYRNGDPRYPMLVLIGGDVRAVPDWPETAQTLDLAAAKGSVYGLVSGAGDLAFWRSDGQRSERLAGAGTMPPLRAFTADADGFWGVGNAAGGGALWHSEDGRRWRRVQDLAGGRPNDAVVYRRQVYVAGTGSDGRGILWGPPASPSVAPPTGSPPTWPQRPTGGAFDESAAGAILKAAISEPERYRSRLRDLAYGWALAGAPPKFFEQALKSPYPDKKVAKFRGRATLPAANLGRHVLLWGMGVAGRGRVPIALLERPWTGVSNRSQKWFNSLEMALFAVTWVGQNDRLTLASLINRLDRQTDPLWLRGDIVGALGAVTGKHFGYDIKAWRQWWAEVKDDWPQ